MQSTFPLRRRMLAALIGGVLALAGAQSGAAPSPDANPARQAKGMGAAHAAAKRDLAQFVAHQIATRRGTAPADFPLEVADIKDLKDAVIGHGFPVYTIDPPELLAGRGYMKGMTRSTGQWRFVVMLNKRPIGLATVEQNNGKYETVSYGASVLAKDVDALMGIHGNAEKSNLRFVRIYQARADLLEVADRTDGRIRYAPLHSARESLLLQQRAGQDGTPGNGLLDEAEVLQPLRAAVKNNMAAQR